MYEYNLEGKKIKKGHVPLNQTQINECVRLANNYHKNRKIDQIKALEHYRDRMNRLLFTTLQGWRYYDK
jgi:hypothetical protein